MRRGAPFAAALETLPHLSDPDRRLAHEIAAGVLRERRTLDAHIRTALHRPDRRVPADIEDVLRIGVYQIDVLDRVPARAAVATAVDLARSVGGPRQAAFVNAILRRLTRDDSGADGPAGDTPEDLAARYSHPEWLVARWIDRYGVEGTRDLLEHNNRRPDLVIQPLDPHRPVLEAALREQDIAWDPTPGGGIAIREGGRPDRLPGYPDGWFHVQDPAQRDLLAFAAIPDGTMIWDACAAPGGKAISLAGTHPVLASDLRPERLRRVLANAARTRRRLLVFAADGARPPIRPGSAPAVLLDAPCTATGAMRRHPDARWRLTPERLTSAAERQGRLLDGTAESVQPGGLLVYLTCSLEPEENERQIDGFLDRHPGFQREGPDRTILPGPDRGDGGYGARLRRLT